MDMFFLICNAFLFANSVVVQLKQILLWISAMFLYTHKPLYNTVRYNTVWDITRFKDGPQKCIDYIEKRP